MAETASILAGWHACWVIASHSSTPVVGMAIAIFLTRLGSLCGITCSITGDWWYKMQKWTTSHSVILVDIAYSAFMSIILSVISWSELYVWCDGHVAFCAGLFLMIWEKEFKRQNKKDSRVLNSPVYLTMQTEDGKHTSTFKGKRCTYSYSRKCFYF